MNLVYVGKSKISGKGLFASQAFDAGAKVMEIRGPLHVFESKSSEDLQIYPDWVGVGERLWLDPVIPAKYLNHSCSPNVALQNFRMVNMGDHDIGCYDAIAINPIFEDEEVTMDYSLTEADPFWKMECQCRSPLCRELIGPIQTLPTHLKEAYRPHMTEFFLRLSPSEF